METFLSVVEDGAVGEFEVSDLAVRNRFRLTAP